MTLSRRDRRPRGTVELRRIRAAGWEPEYRPDDVIPLGPWSKVVLTWARRLLEDGSYRYARGEGTTRLSALRDLMRAVSA